MRCSTTSCTSSISPSCGPCDGKIDCVEALLRWDHPTRGPISPTTLIPLAERSGLINEIGRWVFEHACTERNRWASGTGEFRMAVNMSAHQIMAPDCVSMVSHILAETDTDPTLVTIEITEGALIRDTKRALIVLIELKKLGLQLALDDFGTGYSSLSYLKRYPIDIVKIDQSFIADIDRDESSHAIVSKTIEMAHLMDLTVVCEGVETAEQHLALSELGSDLCQGFYFARPMPSDAIPPAHESRHVRALDFQRCVPSGDRPGAGEDGGLGDIQNAFAAPDPGDDASREGGRPLWERRASVVAVPGRPPSGQMAVAFIPCEPRRAVTCCVILIPRSSRSSP